MSKISRNYLAYLYGHKRPKILCMYNKKCNKKHPLIDFVHRCVGTDSLLHIGVVYFVRNVFYSG